MSTYRELKNRHTGKRPYETVLVLQGGGSLGAYECGVYKALHKNGIAFDVVAGTSIGAINAGIIAANEGNGAAEKLEAFWTEISDTSIPAYLSDQARAMFASSISGMYGNPKVFVPRWLDTFKFNNGALFSRSDSVDGAMKWPYLYSIEPLKKTLSRYVDFTKLNQQTVPRLIATCTDIKTSEPVVFDSNHTNIDADSLVACAGFPFYGIEWTFKDGKYLWDGSLLSNTPLREVIDASPKRDKRVFIVNLFPHTQTTLPENIVDAWHRARDRMYTEKTDQNVRMSKVVTKYLLLLKEMHEILSLTNLDENLKARFAKIEKKYCALAEERGAIISEITKIERTEEVHYIFEDADFSAATIKNLIHQGERDTEKALQEKRSKDLANAA